MKLWGGKGRRTAKWNMLNSALKGINITRKTTRNRPGVRTQATVNQDRIIDFETLKSWYDEQHTPVAVGDEFSQAHMYAKKQRNLKFL